MGDDRASLSAEENKAHVAIRSEGASLEVRYVEPSLDLAGLVACLSDAIAVGPPAAGLREGDAQERSQSLLH